MRTKFRYRDGKMVGPDGMPMLNQAERAAAPVAPMVISDTQAALASMTDGRVYDSKSELRKEYRRAGVEEVGTEKVQPRRDWIDERAKRKKQRAEIKASLHKAHSRMGFGAV